MLTEHKGFTLVELLIVVAICSILASILLPVFAQSREKGRQTGCLSNERQLGLAILQYAQDYDETLPNGINVNFNPIDPNGSVAPARVWPGEGWAGQCHAYGATAALYRCASDASGVLQPSSYPVSYGYNANLAGVATQTTAPSTGASLTQLARPSVTVLLFEVANVFANVTDSLEGAENGGTPGINFSPSANGLDNRLYARTDWTTGIEHKYATGYLGGRLPFNPQSTQFADPYGRHSGGSNFLLMDGHVHWLRGATVSSGLNALGERCDQDNQSATVGCGSTYHAAGTASLAPNLSATFSLQ